MMATTHIAETHPYRAALRRTALAVVAVLVAASALHPATANAQDEGSRRAGAPASEVCEEDQMTWGSSVPSTEEEWLIVAADLAEMSIRMSAIPGTQGFGAGPCHRTIRNAVIRDIVAADRARGHQIAELAMTVGMAADQMAHEISDAAGNVIGWSLEVPGTTTRWVVINSSETAEFIVARATVALRTGAKAGLNASAALADYSRIMVHHIGGGAYNGAEAAFDAWMNALDRASYEGRAFARWAIAEHRGHLRFARFTANQVVQGTLWRVDDVVDIFDMNGDGQVNAEDAEIVVAPIIRAARDVLDVNGDGKIDDQDGHAVLTTVGAVFDLNRDGQVDESDAELAFVSIIDAGDLNGDGIVDQEDGQAALLAAAQVVDVNGDGTLDEEDVAIGTAAVLAFGDDTLDYDNDGDIDADDAAAAIDGSGLSSALDYTAEQAERFHAVSMAVINGLTSEPAADPASAEDNAEAVSDEPDEVLDAIDDAVDAVECIADVDNDGDVDWDDFAAASGDLANEIWAILTSGAAACT